MKYQEIREAFKTCSIVISDDGVALIFHSGNGTRATVTINDREFNNLALFAELISMSKTIKIMLMPNGKSEFQFCFDIPVETDLLFSPLERTKSDTELQDEIRDAISCREPTADWIDAFRATDFSDQKQVLDGLSKFMESTHKKMVFTIDGVRSWENLKKEGEKLHQKWDTVVAYFEPPDEYMDFGVIDFVVESKSRKVFELSTDTTNQFLNVVSASSSVVLESYQEDNTSGLVISFYS